MSAPKLTAAERWERYERARAEHERALQVWRDGGKQGPPPPAPVAPHTPGWMPAQPMDESAASRTITNRPPENAHARFPSRRMVGYTVPLAMDGEHAVLVLPVPFGHRELDLLVRYIETCIRPAVEDDTNG